MKDTVCGQSTVRRPQAKLLTFYEFIYSFNLARDSPISVCKYILTIYINKGRELMREFVMLNIKPGAVSQSMNSSEQVAARESDGIFWCIFWFILFFRTNTTNIRQNSCDYENNVQLRKNWYYLGNIKYHRLQDYK